jgi:CRP-like cAMP-binding protein
MTEFAQCDPAELRSLFLFEKLSEEQLERLCSEGHVELIEPGLVFTEGDPAQNLYVLIEGKLVTSRRVGGDDVEVARTSQRGVYTGAYMAYLGERVQQVYQNSARVTEPSRFYVLGAECFNQIMNEWFPMSVHLLEGLFFGGQRTREMVGQRERRSARRRACASGSPRCAAS